jgi:hypothetical protein
MSLDLKPRLSGSLIPDTENRHLARSQPDCSGATATRLSRKADAAARGDELFTEQDHDGAAVWRRITDAVSQLANVTPAGPLH